MKNMKARGGLFFLLAALSLSPLLSALQRQSRIPPETARRGTSGPSPSGEIDLRGHVFRRASLQPDAFITGVPAYIWRHGSGPTAAAMVLGYYDTHGFPDLLPGEASSQTEAINLKIASDEHYADYSEPLDRYPMILPDKSEAPAGDEHADNCLADYMWTSQSVFTNYYGWTWSTDVGLGIGSFVRAASSYLVIATVNNYSNIMWTTIKNEILSGRPMVFLVDPDANGEPEHFVTVVGAATEDGVDYYGCYNTWDSDVHWYPFMQNAKGVPWGVHSVNTVFMMHVVHPPANFRIQRIENNFIFFREYINKLNWEANSENKSKIVRYRLFRKPREEDDTSFELLAELDPEVLTYDDRGLRKEALYIYRITSVDESGRESSPAIAGN